MTELQRVVLDESSCSDIQVDGTRLRRVRATGIDLRAASITASKFINVDLHDVEITGELVNVTINGVEIAPLIVAELNRRDPERAKMQPTDVDGYREAWSIVQRRWDETIDRARSLPVELLHEQVDGEWSFVQTLRHLGFATAAWVGRMVLGDPSPWHPLDLPWDEAPGWDGIPWDRDARPTLDEVLELRAERRAMVDGVMASLTGAQLASTVSRTEPGWPQIETFPLADCLRIVLVEEWEHRNYAERDLDRLTASK
jgi:uncharacterized protein YjbI with pentapeptide repeats